MRPFIPRLRCFINGAIGEQGIKTTPRRFPNEVLKLVLGVLEGLGWFCAGFEQLNVLRDMTCPGSEVVI